MKILVVDDDEKDYEAFQSLPFGIKHKSETVHRRSPAGLASFVADHPDLNLIVLDILWKGSETGCVGQFGADAMRDLQRIAARIPVVIHSAIEREDEVEALLPEMMRLGAFDWVSKMEPKHLRSLRFERAFNAAGEMANAVAEGRLLANEQQRRHNVHVAVLFVDMSGFTSMTSAIHAEKTADVMEKFYALVSDAVVFNGGEVDKYIGDAVMAVFGGTEVSSESDPYLHVRSCISAARMVQARAAAFRLETIEPLMKRLSQHLPPSELAQVGQVHVGLESGEVEIARFQRGTGSVVTVIGTPVNVAARLMGAAQGGEAWLGPNAMNCGAPATVIGAGEDITLKNVGTVKRYPLLV